MFKQKSDPRSSRRPSQDAAADSPPDFSRAGVERDASREAGRRSGVSPHGGSRNDIATRAGGSIDGGAGTPPDTSADIPTPLDLERGVGSPARSGRRSGLSLKGQALKFLSQREHSRIELRRKMLPFATRVCVAPAVNMAQPLPASPSDGEPTEAGPCLDKLLDWLECNGLLSQERFAISRIRTRAPRFGAARIKLELAQHGVQLSADAKRQLDETETDRARQVWLRKFGEPAADPAAQAKQMRFLAARGFSGHAIRSVIRSGRGDDESAVGPDWNFDSCPATDPVSEDE